MAKDLDSSDLKDIAEILKAMAHNERLAVARLLSKCPQEKLAVKSIYEKLNLSQPIASRHLTVMKNAGVVRRIQEGQKTYYCLCIEKKNVKNLSNFFAE